MGSGGSVATSNGNLGDVSNTQRKQRIGQKIFVLYYSILDYFGKWIGIVADNERRKSTRNILLVG